MNRPYSRNASSTCMANSRVGSRMSTRGGPCLVLAEEREDGQREGRRLARAGLRGTDEVLAGQHDGHGAFLDGRRRGVAGGLRAAQDGVGQAEVGETGRGRRGGRGGRLGAGSAGCARFVRRTWRAVGRLSRAGRPGGIGPAGFCPGAGRVRPAGGVGGGFRLGSEAIEELAEHWNRHHRTDQPAARVSFAPTRKPAETRARVPAVRGGRQPPGSYFVASCAASISFWLCAVMYLPKASCSSGLILVSMVLLRVSSSLLLVSSSFILLSSLALTALT